MADNGAELPLINEGERQVAGGKVWIARLRNMHFERMILLVLAIVIFFGWFGLAFGVRSSVVDAALAASYVYQFTFLACITLQFQYLLYAACMGHMPEIGPKLRVIVKVVLMFVSWMLRSSFTDLSSVFMGALLSAYSVVFCRLVNLVDDFAFFEIGVTIACAATLKMNRFEDPALEGSTTEGWGYVFVYLLACMSIKYYLTNWFRMRGPLPVERIQVAGGDEG